LALFAAEQGVAVLGRRDGGLRRTEPRFTFAAKRKAFFFSPSRANMRRAVFLPISGNLNIESLGG
jgi:hypothetical protein